MEAPLDAAGYLELYVQEDLGGGGDITSDTLLPPGAEGAGRIITRAPCCVAGLQHAVWVFKRFQVEARPQVGDGDRVDTGATLMELRGPARGMLAAERLALNLLGRMSGIATMTRAAQDALVAAGSDARVAATRKTTPGFRLFEKEAVRIGGGEAHRAGLWDAAMIKDNHRAAAGDIAGAVARLREAHPGKEVTVEAERLQDALAAARAGADWVLIDNQTPEVGRAWAEALRAARPDVRVEASGGIRPGSVAAFAWADRISLGALTQAAPAIDLSLEWSEAVQEAPHSGTADGTTDEGQT